MTATASILLTLLLNAWFFLVKVALRADGHEVRWFGEWFSDVERAWRLYCEATAGPKRTRYGWLFLGGGITAVAWIAAVAGWMGQP